MVARILSWAFLKFAVGVCVRSIPVVVAGVGILIAIMRWALVLRNLARRCAVVPEGAKTGSQVAEELLAETGLSVRVRQCGRLVPEHCWYPTQEIWLHGSTLRSRLLLATTRVAHEIGHAVKNAETGAHWNVYAGYWRNG